MLYTYEHNATQFTYIDKFYASYKYHILPYHHNLCLLDTIIQPMHIDYK